jgi:hypothetical protein
MSSSSDHELKFRRRSCAKCGVILRLPTALKVRFPILFEGWRKFAENFLEKHLTFFGFNRVSIHPVMCRLAGCLFEGSSCSLGVNEGLVRQHSPEI